MVQWPKPRFPTCKMLACSASFPDIHPTHPHLLLCHSPVALADIPQMESLLVGQSEKQCTFGSPVNKGFMNIYIYIYILGCLLSKITWYNCFTDFQQFKRNLIWVWLEDLFACLLGCSCIFAYVMSVNCAKSKESWRVNLWAAHSFVPFMVARWDVKSVYLNVFNMFFMWYVSYGTQFYQQRKTKPLLFIEKRLPTSTNLNLIVRICRFSQSDKKGLLHGPFNCNLLLSMRKISCF